MKEKAEGRRLKDESGRRGCAAIDDVILPVIDKARAASRGFQPLTSPVLIYDEDERQIIGSIAGRLAAAGPRIQWGVTLTRHGGRDAVVFWRAGMLTCGRQ